MAHKIIQFRIIAMSNSIFYMNLELVQTADGSVTLFNPELNEQYHSVNGAITESKHVYINHGYNSHQGKKKTVFEVGFGTGLNTLLTALEAEHTRTPTIYITIEKYPLSEELVSQLNYPELIGIKSASVFDAIHLAQWGETVTISEYFSVHKINLDLTTEKISHLPLFDIIYFDAFGPDKQPEMWDLKIIKNISENTNKGGIFSTYTAKGLVKRNLKEVGFLIEKLPGPPGKREMLRGTKKS